MQARLGPTETKVSLKSILCMNKFPHEVQTGKSSFLKRILFLPGKRMIYLPLLPQAFALGGHGFSLCKIHLN